MTAWDYIAAGTGSWLVLGSLGATVPHRLRRHRKPVAQAEHVNWLPVLPPVPPSPRRRESSWLDNVPSDCLVDADPLLHNRFWDIVDAETRWFADGAA